jgi:hypothetical protein
MRRGSIFWGLVLILIGALFFLQQLGFLSVNIWSLIGPLFLIALGAWVLFGRFLRNQPEVEQAVVSLGGAERARLRLGHGAGRLDIRSGAAADNLLEGAFGGGIHLSTRRSRDQVDVDLRMPSQFFPIFWVPGFSLDWRLRLNPAVRLALDLETGANEAQIDLTDLNLAELRFKSGASSTNVRLPANAGLTDVSVETGVASVDLLVPPGVAGRIRVRSGLSSAVKDQARFPRRGDLYQSEGYENALNKVNILVQVGVGSVTVR